MSISLASDLILDVARAADPQKASATTQALANGAAVSGQGFETALAENLSASRFSRSSWSGGANLPDLSYKAPAAAMNDGATPAQRAKIGLESLLLKEMVEHMLPADATEVFGAGVSGDVWRSMLAEKIADSVARSGALKIGERMFASHQNLLQAHRARSGGGGA